jgi:hypothetical protein
MPGTLLVLGERKTTNCVSSRWVGTSLDSDPNEFVCHTSSPKGHTAPSTVRACAYLREMLSLR